MIDFNSPQNLWLIDYDLTLYPHSESQVLHSLDDNINAFIMKHFHVDVEEASHLRIKYWKKHGTTLAGLMEHEDVDPDDYFDFIQYQDNIIDPRPVDGLRELLMGLSGEKVIFTNGRKDWAERGIRTMELEGVFSSVFGLAEFDWLGKPLDAPYEVLEKHFGGSEHFLFFDDKLENVQTALRRNWTSFWVHPQAAESEYKGLTQLMDLKKWMD